MYELIYISTATKRMDETALNNLLLDARDNNSENNITGMLVYSDREFIQLLEGNKENVLFIFDKIKSDSRHSGIKVFHEGDIESRSFIDWSMAYRGISKDDKLCNISGLEKWKSGELPLNLIVKSPNTGKELFLCLREDLE